MKMKWLFPILIFMSLFFGLLSGNLEAVSTAALNSASEAIRLSFTLMGAICLWSGMTEIANRAKITERLVLFISPLLRLIFGHRLPPKIAQAVAMNLSANMLGLGNAATPLGLAAMQEFQKELPKNHSDTASDDMILFTVMNTSSLQLIPTTIAALRLSTGSKAPMEILPAVLIVSVISLTAAILTARLFSRFSRAKRRIHALF